MNTVKTSSQKDTLSEVNMGDLYHIYCLCDEDNALCGWDLTEAEEDCESGVACIVCEELDFSETFTCKKCGT